MKRLLLAVSAAVALAGCNPSALGTLPSSPAQAADRTTLDEQGALTVELAYSAVRLAVETGVDVGIIRGSIADRFAELDRRAYAAVLAVRAAYRAGNADSYAAAQTIALDAVAQLFAVAEGGE
jgi:hypothetical protein